jgi:hypothetical protein
MLLDWANTGATGVACDDELLRIYYSASQRLLNAFPGIIKHRHIWVIGDDGSMELYPCEDGCVDESFTHPFTLRSSSASEAEL